MRQSNIIKSVAISENATGAHALVAAKIHMKARVLGWVFQTAGTVTVKFQSGSNDLTGAYPCAANTVVQAPMVPDPDREFWCESKPGEALNIYLSGNVQVSGVLTYMLVGMNV